MADRNVITSSSDSALRPFSKDVRALLQRALDAGATIELNANGHAVVKSPNGATMMASRNSGQGEDGNRPSQEGRGQDRGRR